VWKLSGFAVLTACRCSWSRTTSDRREWGKSSLLDALTLLLSPEDDLYHFVRDDFWFPPGDVTGREKHLHIILTFRESEPGRHRVRRFRPMSPCWVPCDDDFHRIFYRLEGEMAENDSVLTLREFLDGKATRSRWTISTIWPAT
jgi:putative ATP-dependent endonuclease of OLD family